MKLQIKTYGNKILREKCAETSLGGTELRSLIENMWETMEYSNGCGLAAPQIGNAIKLFIVDTKSTYEALKPEDRLDYFEKNDCGILETFINAKILSRSSESWVNYEGCLSLPGISKEVVRPWGITIEYYDLNLKKQKRTFGGYTARVIQHEYDHTEGILYIDRIDRLSRKMIDGRLKKILKGQVK